uniref:Uncharacterized protein n=1 Tax=Heterorhabditis bacteriophora TaxID=37862 RepID=A0A1I7X1V0_HETBA
MENYGIQSEGFRFVRFQKLYNMPNDIVVN